MSRSIVDEGDVCPEIEEALDLLDAGEATPRAEDDARSHARVELMRRLEEAAGRAEYHAEILRSSSLALLAAKLRAVASGLAVAPLGEGEAPRRVPIDK